MSRITVLYFARLRETLGVSREELDLTPALTDLAALRSLLASRGGVWVQEMAPQRNLRAAVNQEVAAPDAPLRAGDEVAFFPPVTGG